MGRAADRRSDSASDISVGTLELGLEADFGSYASGFVLLKAEDIGTEDETGIFVDEATLGLLGGASPIYLVVGKRAQPFGVFENHLVSDPIARDAYETNELARPWDTGVRATRTYPSPSTRERR